MTLVDNVSLGGFGRAVLVALVLIAGGGRAAAAQSDGDTRNAVTPPEVFANVAVLRAELELIRQHLGRKTDQRAELDVRGAAPREVFFQAFTLVEKSERLAFEHTRRREVMPPAPSARDLQPADVLELVLAGLRRVGRAKTALGISQKVPGPVVDASKTPNDVFRSVVQANRQLNILLASRFQPSDAFMKVTHAVGFAARLLSRFPDAHRIDRPKPMQAAALPPDVYRLLWSCYRHLTGIAKHSKVQMLELDLTDAEIARATPSDVYDLASLLVSELAFLHAIAGDLLPAVMPYAPGTVRPPDVLQRAGILDAQLKRIGALAAAHPDWLHSK